MSTSKKTREIYHSLRRSYRIAKRDLTAPNAFAVCREVNRTLRNLTNSWDVGLIPPTNPLFKGISTAWVRNSNGRARLFVSRSLTNWLKMEGSK